MSKPLNHVQVELLRAKELISDESRWTKRAVARAESGAEVDYDSDSAVSWCMLGALGAVGASAEARFALEDASGGIVLSNDDHDHATVMRIMDYAIELAGKRGSR